MTCIIERNADPKVTLTELLEGNRRYMHGGTPPTASAELIANLARVPQRPKAVVVGCSDCRVSPELVFCQGVGDLYVVRKAGLGLTEAELDSVAYGVNELCARLVIVLGHTGCGETPAASDGQIGSCVQEIQSLEALQDVPGLLVVGARYDLESGQVCELNGPSAAPPPQKRGTFHAAVQIGTWAAFVLLMWGAVVLTLRTAWLLPCDTVLFFLTLLTVAVAVTCSQAYNGAPELYTPGSAAWEAERMRSIWLHSNFCWLAANIWMTVAPLYCTCTVIYLSMENKDQAHILLYSVFSLVIALAAYVVRPSSRANGFRSAYLKVSRALLLYRTGGAGGAHPERILAESLIDGELAISEQDMLDPQ